MRLGVEQWLEVRRPIVALTCVVVLLGGVTVSSSNADASTARYGTIVASGAVRGRWTINSCTFGDSQGFEIVNMYHGPSATRPVANVLIQIAVPVPKSGSVNLATAESDQVQFTADSDRLWMSGATYSVTPKDDGSGRLAFSSSGATATLTTDVVRKGSAGVHLSVNWSHCRATTIPEN